MTTATQNATPANKADRYAPKPRALNEREKKRVAEKLRRNARNKRNARHG